MKRRLSKKRLEELIEEATVDAYGESEQAGGFYTMMDDNLRLPFNTRILGVEVILAPLGLTKGELIYVAKKDFYRCGTRSARGSKKGAYIRPASVNRLGGYYTARTQRVDMLD